MIFFDILAYSILGAAAMYNEIVDWLNQHEVIKQILIVIGILLLSYLSHWVTKRYILKWLGYLVKRSKSQLDDIIFDKIMPRRLAYIIPILIVYNFSYLSPTLGLTIQRISLSLMFLILLTTLNSFLMGINSFYEKDDRFKGRPIKGYIQAFSIVAHIVGGLIIIGVLTGQSLWVLMSGIGALTAVILLIFRDTILSFVASLEITSYDLVRVGDWIEAPHFNADGDVIDISLHTIKVQNFDKTITVLPTHKLIDNSFKNWRGMQESGGRRIKRSINIDINSIRFCDDAMLEKFEKIELLKDYLEEKKNEIGTDNESKNIDTKASLVNGRRLSNVGTFRAYIEAYLRRNEKIHDLMTFLVRQLQPGPTGLPIEIYVFTNDTRWSHYEAIQGDIFDHIFAAVREFDLKIYQYPASVELQKL